MTPVGIKWADAVPGHLQGAILEALERFPANAVETYRTHLRSTVGHVVSTGTRS
ncbi:MAG: hypothetical protein U5L11_14675 [Arhodomonas sp.]|nr:hypothetical protein [Arhodomonas sp.]